jgi:multisubunit Na+/H+ antiporter MnhC subunit
VSAIVAGVAFLAFGVLVFADTPRKFATRAIAFANRTATLSGKSDRDPLVSRMILGGILVAAGLLFLIG